MSIRILSLTLAALGLLSIIVDRLGSEPDYTTARTSRWGNGQPKEVTFFLDGLRHGFTTRWYDDGSLRSQGTFEHGKMTGKWLWKLPNGEDDPARSGYYEFGQRVSF